VLTEKAFYARVGARIRAVRLTKGLSQTEVAKRIKSYQQNVGRTERGTENLTLDVILRIANALDVDPVEFFTGDAKIKKTSRDSAPTRRAR
jgi:transcriptional regulator with XRE-family HTH domain